MSISPFAHENTPASAYGEFDAYDVTRDWTEADWADYDAHIAQELADFEADLEDDYVDLDPEPPF